MIYLKFILKINIMSKKIIQFEITGWHSEDYLDESEINDDSDSDSDDSNDKKYKINKDKSLYKIIVWGKDINEKTYTLEINEFTPYFYIKLPNNARSHHKDAIENFVRRNMWKKYQDCFLRTTLLKKHSFRNFDNKKKYKFVRLVFSNQKAMKCAINLFQNREYDSMTKKTKRSPKKLTIPGIINKPTVYELYENNIDSLLKFIHHKHIKPSSWIKLEKYTISKNLKYNSDYFLTTRWSNVKPLSDDELKYMKNAKTKIMGFDIECDSSHGDFPLPIKDYIKLAREIYDSYKKLNQHKKKLQENINTINNDKKIEKSIKNEIKEINSVLENRIDYIKKRLVAAFKNGSEELNVSKIYTKNVAKFRSGHFDKISEKLAQYLTISNNTNSIERKKHCSRCINKINKILNESFPAVKGDQTIQIGISFLKYGETVPYKNYMLTLDTCDKLKNAETFSFKTEKELLLKFKEIIIKEDPEIITGWNTDGFDTPWLFKRADELGINEQFNYLSRIKNFKSILKEKQVKGPTGELIKKEYVDIPGRIQMDMLPLVRKSYNLGSYKLDNVSAEFINGKVNEVKYNEDSESTTIFTSDLKGLNIGNYIVFNIKDGYLENKFDNGKKFQIKNLDRKDNSFTINGKINLKAGKNVLWCLGKDDIGPKDIFRLQKGTSKDRAILAYYCMMDVILCHELLNKLQLFTKNKGMSNVCKNPLSWIIHRGQGVKILSLVSYFLKQKDYLLPFLYKDSFSKEGYEGAVVLDPNPGIYIDEPVAVLDYGSLYPSSMIEMNLSHETIVTDEQYLGEEGGKKLNELGYDYEDISYDIFKTIYGSTGNVKSKLKIGIKTVRFVQYRDGTKGLIPQILNYLLTARKTTRAKIKYKTVKLKNGEEYTGLYDSENGIVKTHLDKWTFKKEDVIDVIDTYGDFEKSVFDGEQLAYKLTANSTYGQLGAKTSDIYYKEIAASTTATGRARLIIAKDYAENEKNYPQKLKNGKTIYLKNKVVYGDTDSVFVKYQTLDDEGNPLRGREARKKSIELAIYTEKEIQKNILRPPQNLEYEKTFDPFILLSKKRYVGNLYETDPDKFKLKSMGIVLKRRDNAPIVKVIYGGIIDIIMKQKDIKPSIDYLRKTLIKLVNGKFGLDTLIITKTLSSFYKDPDRIVHRVLADRIAERDPGNKPKVNDRIPYIYMDVSHIKNNKSLLQGERVETPEFMKKNKIQPDYEFYITNQILKPVSQIFSLALDQIPGYSGDITEYDRLYNKYLTDGKSINDSLKKINEKKSKEAANILFGDILRRLANKRNRNNEITSYFRVVKK